MVMKHARISLLTLVVLALSITRSQAQNLVPNGSFEEYTQCPDFLNQMNRATGWSRYHRSPDYFNSCLVNGLPGGGIVGVPSNVAGWQLASTGIGYAGALVWEEPSESVANQREHLGATLLAPLQIGVPVYISFKVSVAVDGSQIRPRFSASGAGLRFTTTPYLQDWPPIVPNQAALSMSTIPVDTAIWYDVSGVYIPDSAYECVVLGNFFDDSITSVVQIDPTGNGDLAYVYFDDVCVTYDPNGCDFSLSTEESRIGPSVRASYSSSTQTLTVHGDEELDVQLNLSLFDVLGRAIWRGQLLPGTRYWSQVISGISEGSFFLHAHTGSGEEVRIELKRSP
jgi:hypothetical protein